MAGSMTVRLLLVSSRRSRRQSVREAIEFYGGNRFEIHETGRAERIASLVRRGNFDVVVLARPEIQELLTEFISAGDAPVPIFAIGDKHTKLTAAELNKAGIQAYLPANDLYKLPSLLIKLASAGVSQNGEGEEVSAGERQAMASHLMDPHAVRESQKLISIGRLAAEIAHEINNPLESVGNLIYLAQCEAHLPERAGEYLRSAERELARVVQISKQTLSFHRESNEPMKLQMSELMDEVVSLYSRRIQQKKLNVTREYVVGQSITALPGEIRQVLSNLVTNAIEASSSGGTLRLRIREAQEWAAADGVRGLRITVADGGSGISEENRRRLGELFFTTKGQSGTGLGLWVTKSIVARYGGSLRLKSSTGERHGTVFSLFLPFSTRTAHVEAAHVEANSKDVATAQSATAQAKRGNVTEISNHPSHHGNQAHTPASFRQQPKQPKSQLTQKRNG